MPLNESLELKNISKNTWLKVSILSKFRDLRKPMKTPCTAAVIFVFCAQFALFSKTALAQPNRTHTDPPTHLTEITGLEAYLQQHATVLPQRYTPSLLTEREWAQGISAEFLLKMDSVVAPEERKQVYAYNAEGLLTEWIQSFYQIFSATFSPEIRVAFSYDGNLNPTGELVQNWNGPEGTWANDELIDYLYNSDGNRLLREGFSWNSAQEDWTFAHRTEWEYNEDQRVSLERRFALSGGTIFPFQEDSFFYSDDGRLDSTVTLQQNPSNFQWNLHSRERYTYENELLVAVLTEGWDGQMQAWFPQGLSEYTYPNDNAQEMTLFQWNATGGVWFPISKVHTTFDSAGNETEVIFYTMENGTWRPVFGYARTFDGFENMLTYTEQIWSPEQQSLVALREVEWDFDYAYTVDQLALPLWTLNLGFVHKPDGAQVTLFADGAPSSEYYETYYYGSAASLAVRNALLKDEVVPFPNPAHDYIQVHQPLTTGPVHYALYNLQGKAISQGTLAGKESDKIYVDHLVSGIYLLKLTHGGEICIHKVVKK